MMTLERNMKSILVPTDFSEGFQDVIDYAVLIAKKFEGRLSFLHVIEPMMVYELYFSFAHSSGSSELRGRMMEALKKKIDPVKDQGIEIEEMILMGLPSREIVKFAKARGVDLIVMGTRGRTGLSHVLLGSTAERVIQHAPCPVLTIHSPKKHP